MTIGIHLIPIVVLMILLVWIAGYLLRVYAVSWRVASALSSTSSGTGAQLLVLTAGLVVFALFNFIPVLGWLVNLLVVFLGLGAFVQRGAALVSDRTRAPPAPDAAPPLPVDGHR